MPDEKLKVRTILRNVLLVYTIVYLATFILAGIVWDPNGVAFFERDLPGALIILVGGFLMAFPLGSFALLAGPFPDKIIGFCLLACVIKGCRNAQNDGGRLLLYVAVSLITIIGEVMFCLQA